MNIDSIIRPINTEKTMALMEKGIYSFLVSKDATKTSLKNTIEELFKVKVESINVLNRPGKAKIFKGKRGKTSDQKRIFVKVKEGKIDFEGGF